MVSHPAGRVRQWNLSQNQIWPLLLSQSMAVLSFFIHNVTHAYVYVYVCMLVCLFSVYLYIYKRSVYLCSFHAVENTLYSFICSLHKLSIHVLPICIFTVTVYVSTCICIYHLYSYFPSLFLCLFNALSLFFYYSHALYVSLR